MKNQPLTEEEIIAATVGDRIPHNSTILLVPYDPEWPLLYSRLEKKIRNALGEVVQLLEHVGSTSVPGLSAKPVIDMILVVPDSRDEAAYVEPLEEEGFVLRIREPNWCGHRLLKAPDIRGNLHVFSTGCVEVERMLIFRNWLRRNPSDRLLYERTKQELAGRIWKYGQNYADAKSEVIEEILLRANSCQSSNSSKR